jgi:hypothetical protein
MRTKIITIAILFTSCVLSVSAIIFAIDSIKKYLSDPIETVEDYQIYPLFISHIDSMRSNLQTKTYILNYTDDDLDLVNQEMTMDKETYNIIYKMWKLNKLNTDTTLNIVSNMIDKFQPTIYYDKTYKIVLTSKD